MPLALIGGMETVLNHSLFIRLQMLSLEPEEICLRVHTYGGEGCIHVSYRKILHAVFREEEGAAAILAMFALKDSWISEVKEPCPKQGNLHCFIEEFLMETVSEDPARKETRLIKKRSMEKKFGRPICWQGLINDFEITLTVVGGPWDGHTFEVHPGDNLVGKIPECDIHLPTETVSRRHCCILLSEAHIRIIDLGSLNGTFLNGTLVQDANLAPEDELCLGDVHLKVMYTLRRPSLGADGGDEKQTGDQGKENRPPRLADCKTINWKEFVPKKKQILGRIISGFR